MIMDIDVIGLGSLNYDFTFQVDNLASGDQQVVINASTFSPGGSSANSIYWLARLGVATGFLGALGSDLEGKKILSHMTEAGIEVSKIAVLPPLETSKVFVFVDSQGERAMYSLPGASLEFQVSEENLKWLKSSKYVMISAIPGQEQLRQIEKIVNEIYKDTRVVFMPGAIYTGYGYRELEPILNKTFLLVLNRREIATLTDRSYQDGVCWLVENVCNIVAVTLGSEGCIIGQGNDRFQIAVPELAESKIVDSTGAGDSFTAGLVYGLLGGRSLKQAALLANLLARECIQHIGARTGEMDREALELEFGRYWQEE